MLKVFREIERTREPLIITDRGKPVLEVKALRSTPSAQEALARLRHGHRPPEVSEASLLEPLGDDDWALGADET